MRLNDKIFFPALTGYRAIAAWLIFVYHFFPFKNPNIPSFFKSTIGELHIGVDMFFVLSGFLITYRYFGDRPIIFKNYMINRIARIYPMYLMITLLVFINIYVSKNIWSFENTKQFIVSITMTKALFKDYYFSGIAQGWTLTLEELFYISAPFYFILIKKNWKFLFILPTIIFLFGFVLKTVANGNFWGLMQINIANYIFEFFAGIALALVIKKQYFGKINFNHFTYSGLAAIIIYLSTRHFVSGFVDFQNEFIRASELFSISVFGIAPLLYGLIFEKTFIQKILSTDIMILLGKSSYLFYLIHKGFIPILFNNNISDNKFILFLFLNLLSIIMYKYLEEPINNYIRKKFTTKSV